MANKEYRRRRVKIPLKCWAHEDEGVRWLAVRLLNTNPQGFYDEHHRQFDLIQEVRDWLYDNNMWYDAIYPNGFYHADLMFRTRVDALKFACTWL